ncbi:MAG: alpha/beta hydrolase [Pseudomonadota bacterium]
MSGQQSYEDGNWESEDGLKLHYRDYSGASDRLPVICIPGLTRNARDFANLPDLLTQKPDHEPRRTIMVDLRGRGESEYAKDSSTYNAKSYVADIVRLMEQQAIPKAVFFGTSLGGIVTMLLARKHGDRVGGVLLNDIGPELDPAGLQRIGDYVGQGRSFETWAHAGRDLAATSGDIFPDFKLQDWIDFAKKVYRMNSSGRIKLDYDMKISEPFNSQGDGSKALWDAMTAMKDIPTLIIRGELSDLFAAATANRMLGMLDQGELATVPRAGHAPTLEEPAALDAIAGMLQRID